jgi:hypothetical protein
MVRHLTDPAQLQADAEEADRAMVDPSHPWRNSLVLFVAAFDRSPVSTQLFMRSIAPYLFDANGDIKRPKR